MLSSVILFLGIFGQRTVATIFKIIADISKYFGDENYRDRILFELDTLISNQHKSTRIVLLAHSLGSVIAVDSLLRGSVWTRDHHVTLLTAGSPLKRLVWRFFPGALLADSATACIQIIGSRIGSIAWINCYRPWDQIGTSLGLSSSSIGEECNTYQLRRLASAHTNYWRDQVVFKNILFSKL